MTFSDLLVKGRIDPKRYARHILLPLVALAIGLAAFIYLLGPLSERIGYLYPLGHLLDIMGFWYYLLYSFPMLIFAYALLYPKIIVDKRMGEIDNNMHYYVTHWGVLSRAEIKISDLLLELSPKKEYKALAEETGYLYSLHDKWGKTFPDACRFLRKRTPSKPFSDFLGRIAHAIDSGQDVRQFLQSEQEAVMSDFTNTYERRLYSIDVFKEIYISIVVSIVFMGVIAVIAPFISGMSPLMILAFVFVLFVFAEMLSVYYLKLVCPADPLWQVSEVVTARERKRKNLFFVSLFLCALVLTANLVALHLGISPIPPHYKYHFILATSIAPLILVGSNTKREENLIKRKDNLIPTFLRSIGAAAGTTGGKITDTVGYLSVHDFYPLTDEIIKFHRRLSTRINEERAWTLFTTGTSSNLIYRFCDIFRGGLALGCNPAEVGNFVATNMDKTNNLRKKRSASAATLIGILYGLIAAIGFCLFVTFGITGYLNDTWGTMSAETEITPERIELLEHEYPEVFEHHLRELSSTLSALPMDKLSETLAEYFPTRFIELMSSVLATVPPERLAPSLNKLSTALRDLPSGELERIMRGEEPREITPRRLAELPTGRIAELTRAHAPALLGELFEEFAPERVTELPKEFAPENLAMLYELQLKTLFVELPYEKRLAFIADLDRVEEERTAVLERRAAELRAMGGGGAVVGELERTIGEIEDIQARREALEEAGAVLTPIPPFEMELTSFILLLMLVSFAMASSLALVISDGGHPFGSLGHFVFLTWVGFLAGILAEQLLPRLLIVV